jgi:hypothetical protein
MRPHGEMTPVVLLRYDKMYLCFVGVCCSYYFLALMWRVKRTLCQKDFNVEQNISDHVRRFSLPKKFSSGFHNYQCRRKRPHRRNPCIIPDGMLVSMRNMFLMSPVQTIQDIIQMKTTPGIW